MQFLEGSSLFFCREWQKKNKVCLWRRSKRSFKVSVTGPVLFQRMPTNPPSPGSRLRSIILSFLVSKMLTNTLIPSPLSKSGITASKAPQLFFTRLSCPDFGRKVKSAPFMYGMETGQRYGAFVVVSESFLFFLTFLHFFVFLYLSSFQENLAFVSILLLV